LCRNQSNRNAKPTKGKVVNKNQTAARYGSWRSPITSDLIVAEVIGLSEVQIEGQDIYWIESRPNEAGRSVVVKQTATGAIADAIPSTFSARTLVHEYGGGAYTVSGGVVFFSNFSDQRLYRLDIGSVPTPITPAIGDLRYADSIVDLQRKSLICIREDHRDPQNVVNSIVAIAADGSQTTKILVSGNDFYSSPRVSPDGKQLAWLTWNHPNMPWVGTELWVGSFASDGSVGAAKQVAGGTTESIFQPEWSIDGLLHFVSDRSGWWNIYRLNTGSVQCVTPLDAEFAVPQWTFGLSCYAFAASNQIFCTYTKDGTWHLALIEDDKLKPINVPGTDFAYLRASQHKLVCRSGSSTQPFAIAQLDLQSQNWSILRQSAATPSPQQLEYISIAEFIDFPTEDGLTAHAFLYRPKNPDYVASSNELPPLIVKSHGGPTAAASSTLDFKVQYWTSRGYAVLDVNYGGSTGYGRDYRYRLQDKWGVVDLDDCVNGAKALVDRGIVDTDRLLITGGSAGGYTTLCALTFRKVFRAGASYYGISDLEALAKDTHKFESHYMEWLVAPYPQGIQIYRDRSPIHSATKLSVPVIFFQGEEDKIVPPNQTELLVAAIQSQGLPFGYLLFAGEQHGFRKGENIKRALDAELYFYAAISIHSGLRF
jgi:dipeptidyl aminopeptidase/acylaminoacyl peptidase